MRVIGTIMVLLFVAGCDNKGSSDTNTHSRASGQEMQMSGDMEKDMQMMNEMMVKHLGTKDRDYEDRFIDMMIPHHEGAIMMAQNALKNANRPEIKEMAQAIIAAQEREIGQLKKWRKDWYGH